MGAPDRFCKVLRSQEPSLASCKDQVAVVAVKGPVAGKEGTPRLKAALIKSPASDKRESL